MIFYDLLELHYMTWSRLLPLPTMSRLSIFSSLFPSFPPSPLPLEQACFGGPHPSALSLFPVHMRFEKGGLGGSADLADFRTKFYARRPSQSRIIKAKGTILTKSSQKSEVDRVFPTGHRRNSTSWPCTSSCHDVQYNV